MKSRNPFARHRMLALSGFTCVAAGLPAWGIEEITVVGRARVAGMMVNVDKVPGNVQTLRASDLNQDGTPNLTGSLSSHIGSVNTNDALADAFQPDILYRGFEASPALGTPQGLAVYQNGVRINEAFGDTVNWDLFPDIAIDRIDIVTASPLFGLNALGGAISVTMKNGFSFHGSDGELSGGSFDRRQGAVEFGSNNGAFGFYAAARLLDQNGWRLFSHDSLRQYYADLSLREGGAGIDLSYTHADNKLYGQGAAPVQSLAINTQNVFTGPQSNFNTLNFVTLNAQLKFTDNLATQGVLYSRSYRQTIANGNTTNYTACNDATPGALCQGDGVTPLTNSAGGLIPDISNGGATLVGPNDFERTHSDAWGASLQLTSAAPLFSRGNASAIAATPHTAHTNFFSGTEVGVLDAALTVVPSGLFVDTPEGTGFSATPVNLNVNDKYYGFYITDTFDLTSLLSGTATGPYNVSEIDLSDQRGTALTGNSRFTHFNPAASATYQLVTGVHAY